MTAVADRDPVRVLVTGVGGGGLGEQLLYALRRAPRPYHLVGADVTPQSAGFPLADATCLLPLAREPGYVDALLAAASAHDVQVVIPASEPELRAVADARARFESAGLFVPIQPAPLLALCDDKARTHEALRAAGIECPRFVRIEQLTDLDAVDFYPCVLKPLRGGSGSAHVALVQDARELRALAELGLAAAGPLCAEAYVGTPETEFTVGVLTDLDGVLVQSIALRRAILGGLSNRLRVPNRTGRAELGAVLAISSGVSQGEFADFPDVRAVAERAAAALGARGPLNVQCRVHEGRVVVFEVNPRFSGTTSLRAEVGFHEADWLIRHHVLGLSPARHMEVAHGVVVRGLRHVFYPSGGTA